MERINELIELSEDNTSGIILNATGIDKVLTDCNNYFGTLNKDAIEYFMELHQTDNGYLLKSSDFSYILNK